MVFLARFLPVISFNLVNYAAGLTRISWWTFGWTTGLGILPMTILMAAMGDQAGRMPWHWWLALLAAAVLGWIRSEEHTSELQSLMRISYAVFCLKKKITTNMNTII